MTTDIEQEVARHYSRRGLEAAILDALRASGRNVERLSAAELSGVDEFHLGWRAATAEIAAALGLGPGLRLLDIGSGIGGPARYFAEAHGCHVTGIDLTEEFVRVADALTRRCGLADRAVFRQASALALPFDAGGFDAATLIHVGMNIRDKAGLFAEARRVLKPGGRFAVYDVMRAQGGELPYPMPWAATPATSFVEPPDAYRRLLRDAGFEIERERDRREFCLELARQMREKQASEGAPPLGLSALMGPAGKERIANVMSALERGLIAPVEILLRAA